MRKKSSERFSVKSLWRAFLIKCTNMTDTNLLLAITIFVFVLMYAGAILIQGQGFLKPQNFCDILNDNAALLIASCGMTLVMINGSIDISVGGVAALVGVCCSVYFDFHDGTVLGSILIALAIGVAYGLIQGYLIAYLEIQPFIVSLAGMFFARGMATIVHAQHFNVASEAFKKLKDTRIFLPIGSTTKKGIFVNAYVEIGVVVALLVVVSLFILLRWTKLGRHFYAVGGNSQSALMLGINVRRTKFIAHLICGVLAGIGGYVYFLHTGSCASNNAAGMEMNAIASSIIGGTMLSGGVGNIIGTFFGVLSLNTIKSIVASAGLGDAWWTGITIAAMLCLFLVIQSVVMARKKSSVKR